MKKYILFTILLIAFTTSIFAQKKSDDGFAPFWKTFKTALAKDDKLTISNLTHFPFGFDSINKKEFIKKYRNYFNDKTKACILKQTPVKNRGDDSMYEIFCESIVYVFTKEKDGWKFVGSELY